MAEAARRPVFSVSDHTGMTAEAFAHSVVSRFDSVQAVYFTRPFVDTPAKIAGVVAEIDEMAQREERPIVFSTLSDPDLQAVLARCDGLVIGMFGQSVQDVSAELGMAPSRRVGRYHGIADAASYELRLDALDFTLMTDDGLGIDHYGRADIILVGVSRVGKTPTCLYLSMHYGIRAANYPLDSADHSGESLPATLVPHRARLHGLTIEPRRLHAIRTQRRPDSEYATLEVCKREVARAERILRAERIPLIDTTSRSVEEITATLIEATRLVRRVT
ncbi:MAG TPA: pyruvate, water dikinase regulatory protein [Acidimicrobiia bacterium]|jgi:hypothetical protein